MGRGRMASSLKGFQMNQRPVGRHVVKCECIFNQLLHVSASWQVPLGVSLINILCVLLCLSCSLHFGEATSLLSLPHFPLLSLDLSYGPVKTHIISHDLFLPDKLVGELEALGQRPHEDLLFGLHRVIDGMLASFFNEAVALCVLDPGWFNWSHQHYDVFFKFKIIDL